MLKSSIRNNKIIFLYCLHVLLCFLSLLLSEPGIQGILTKLPVTFTSPVCLSSSCFQGWVLVISSSPGAGTVPGTKIWSKWHLSEFLQSLLAPVTSPEHAGLQCSLPLRCLLCALGMQVWLSSTSDSIISASSNNVCSVLPCAWYRGGKIIFPLLF